MSAPLTKENYAAALAQLRRLADAWDAAVAASGHEYVVGPTALEALGTVAQALAEGTPCTNKGCVLPDRADKSYQCNGVAQWCTACLRWHYEHLAQDLAEREDMLRRLEWCVSPSNASPSLCPMCGAIKELGHHRVCSLAALLPKEAPRG